MRITLTLSSLALTAIVLLSSCATVTFQNQMPQAARNLPAFPEHYIGDYEDSEEPGKVALTITEKGFVSGEMTGELGETEFIKPYKGYLVYNSMEEENQWQVILARISKDEVLTIYIIDPEEEGTLEKIEKVAKVEKFHDEDGDLDRVHLDISDRQFQRLVESQAWTPLGVLTKMK